VLARRRVDDGIGHGQSVLEADVRRKQREVFAKRAGDLKRPPGRDQRRATGPRPEQKRQRT
jgi:hypothetical protein